MDSQHHRHFYFLQRRLMTLIEVLIAMGLVSILMTALMGFYAQIEYVHTDVDRAREEGFELRYIQARLSKVLPRIIAVEPPAKEKEKAEDFYFFTSQDENGRLRSPSLVFTYDNGVDLEALFSHRVLGRIFLEQEGENRQLSLATWPVPRCWREAEPPMQKEVLLEHVTDLEFSFFNPRSPEDDGKVQSKGVRASVFDKNAKVEAEKDRWHERWGMEYQDLPAIIKLRIKRDRPTGLTPANEWVEFAFPLPNAKKMILVEK